MTDPKDDLEFSEEHVEDLEAPASLQEAVAGGMLPEEDCPRDPSANDARG
jgi:hypothetical protein